MSGPSTGATEIPGAAPPLRIAVITRDHTIAAWQAAALARLRHDDAQIVLRVDLGSDDHHRAPPGPLRRTGARAWDLYRSHRLEAPGRAWHGLDADAVVSGVPVVTTATGDGGLHRLGAAVTDHLRRTGCDLAVNLSGRALRAPPGAALPHGMWEHRVALADGGRPRDELTSATTPALLELSLVRVADGQSDDQVLRRGWIHTVPRSLAATVDDAHFTAGEWLAATCHTIRVCGTPSAPSGRARAAAPLDDPAMLRIAAGSAWRRLRWALRQLVWQEEWHVGVVDQPLEEVFHAERITQPVWLDSPSPRHYLADPFGRADSDTILVEDYDYLTRRGFIAAVDIATADGRPVARPVLRTAGHMSYPYLLEWGGHVYCVPETSDQRRAVLHRASRFPDAWEQVAVLVDGLAVADPTIVRHEGRWWLFCTDDALGPGSNLHVYHADELTGPWRPHEGNPVKIDIRSARPAGTPFVVDGALIRPAQENAKGYGSGVVFNRVDRLSPEAFEEHPVARLEPQPGSPYRHGLHTVSAWGARTLIDGKRKGPSLTNLVGRVRTGIR